MEPFTSYLKFWIKLDGRKLNDPEEKARDVSKLGHHGVGNYEINIKSDDDLYYFMGLVKQSYDDKN